MNKAKMLSEHTKTPPLHIASKRATSGCVAKRLNAKCDDDVQNYTARTGMEQIAVHTVQYTRRENTPPNEIARIVYFARANGNISL